MRKIATRVLLAWMLIVSFTIAGFGQQRRTVTGVLQDGKGVPVPGASIVEKGTPNGTSSSTDGTFSISVRPNAILQVSAIGFETQDMNTGTDTKITILLTPATTELGGVVVTALGITKQKRQLGFSVTEVKGLILPKPMK